MLKESIQQEDITFVNIYTPSMGALKYVKQTLTDLKGEIDNNTIIVEDFNILLASMNRSSRQETKKETLVLNNTLDWMDLTDVYQTFHPKATE